MFDLVIKNGHVVDPKNGVSALLHIGVAGGKIAQLSAEPLLGEKEIDAAGLIVCPGFVDIHMHEDPYAPQQDAFSLCIAESMLRMGVTTAIGGNCGIGSGYTDPLAYLDAVDRIGLPIHLGMLAPHEILRNKIGVHNVYQELTANQIEEMIPLLDQQLTGGCIGFSMGMEYIPGTNETELVKLMDVAAKRGRVTAIHMRSDAEKSLPAIQEMIDAAQNTSAALQISHLASMSSFGQIERALAKIDAYRYQHLDVAFDCYPYYAYCTTIGSACFDDGFLDAFGLGDEGYERLEIASGSLAGTMCTKELFFQVRKAEPEALLVAHLLNGDEVDRAICHPAAIVASDGIYHQGKGHPRGSGTFPRFIHEYVVKQKKLSLEAAIEKMTWLPSKRFQLNKGTLSIGADADITVFNLNKIKDGATFQTPTRPPEGIVHVLIGGEVAFAFGEIKNKTLGRALRATHLMKSK